MCTALFIDTPTSKYVQVEESMLAWYTHTHTSDTFIKIKSKRLPYQWSYPHIQSVNSHQTSFLLLTHKSESLQMIPSDSTPYWPQGLPVHDDWNFYPHEEFHCNHSDKGIYNMFHTTHFRHNSKIKACMLYKISALLSEVTPYSRDYSTHWTMKESGYNSHQRQKIILSPTAPISALGPTRSHLWNGYWGPLP
jgi:hypothetical protein